MTPEQQAGQEAAKQSGGQIVIQKIYIKDVSFETPNSPQIFMLQGQPQPVRDVKLSTNSTVLGENLYEVVLGVTLTLSINDKTAFLVEVQQAGIFTLQNFSAEELPQVIGRFCTGNLFPFLRETVSDLVTRGGFPPLLLEPINFDALYAQQVNQANQARQAGQVATSDSPQ
ncbi:MAG: protein-export chaperone SecB [Gammaproteobacteria bacterium]|nr:protein-export chaperone SecB [Gammaproteobacteria bacterium]